MFQSEYLNFINSDIVNMENKHQVSNISETNITLKTAGIRKIRTSFTLLPSVTSEDPDNDPVMDLEELLKQTWNIWAVSTLFNFQSKDEVQLKLYAKKLREEIACILTKEDVSYDAKVSVLEFRTPKSTDHPVIKIEIFSTVADKSSTCAYKGYLFSWRSELLTTLKNATQLPLLLCRGTTNTIRATHTTLSAMFDCMFVPLPLDQEDLKWLLPIFFNPNCGQDTAKNTDETAIEYIVPNLPSSETITIKFMTKDLIELWSDLGEQRDTIYAEEVKKFNKALHLQIRTIFQLTLDLCVIHKLRLPSITISRNQMKVSNVNTMNIILTYLNEKAMDALHNSIMSV